MEAIQVNDISGEAKQRIENLLEHGAGVSLVQIACAAGCEPGPELEGYLLGLIARGYVKRRWNKVYDCHFYERLKDRVGA